MSNYLEHLESSDAVIEQLRVASTLLRPGGRVIVLQPNIRLVGPRYWDFIDHRVALTDGACSRQPSWPVCGPSDLITRFLPYSTKGRLPSAPRLVRAYLAFRPAWCAPGQADAARRAATERYLTTCRSCRSSCPSSTRARRSSPSCGPCRPAFRRRTRSSSSTTSTRTRRSRSSPASRARSPTIRGLRNDLGRGVLNAMKAGIAGIVGAVRAHLHGRRLRRAARRRPDGRPRPRRGGRRRRIALHARRATDRWAAAQAADEPDRGPDAALVRGRADPRPDEQLQALLPSVPGLGDDREHAPGSSSPSS